MLKLIDRLEILRKKPSVGKKRLLSRMDLLARKGELTRQGLRSSHVGYASAYRVRERLNVKVIPRVESTTFRSPLISGVYHSVFAPEVDHVR